MDQAIVLASDQHVTVIMHRSVIPYAIIWHWDTWFQHVIVILITGA